MVDLDNLTKFSKSGQYPDLLNSSDVERVKEILEAHPDIFSPRLDRELGIIKTSPTKPNRYGFKFDVPTGIDQVELFDGTILQNAIFKYLCSDKAVYFEEGNTDTPIEEYLFFEPVPLFSATIEALCQLTTEITGNSDTSKLTELLNLLEDVVANDYEIATLILSKVNKTIRIGLHKRSDTVVSTEVFKFLGTRSNTKIYQSCQSVSMVTEEILLNDNNRVELFFEFNSTGLVKELAYGLYPRYNKNYNLPIEGENFNKEVLHTATVSTVVTKSKTHSWLPDKWIDEISTWENHHPDAVFGVTILTGKLDGNQTELMYGF